MPTILLSFILLPWTALAQPSLARHPYIRMITTSSVVIAWQTGTPVTGSVEYGTTPGFGHVAQGVSFTTSHAVRITGLDPGTLYYYRILGDGLPFPGAGDAVTVTTSPDSRSIPFAFIVFGDLGCGCPAQRAVAEAMKGSDFAFALLTGDIIYPAGEAELYGPNFFDIYRDILPGRPFYPVIGNHDLGTNNGRPYLDAFGTERYYSFEYAGAYFIGLDTFSSSYSKDSAQYTWLEDNLRMSTAPWKFVYLHDPPYSSSRHGSNLSIRKTLSPLFEKYGVNIVFAGHDHAYERTVPVREFGGGHPVVYIVSGGGGADLYPVGKSGFTAFSASRHHFIHVLVKADSAEIEAVGTDGRAFDAATLERAPIVRSRGCGSIP